MSDNTRLASLPMYCEDEVRPATERWWAGLARHMRDCGVAGCSRHADLARRLSRPLALARAAFQPDLRLSLRERARAGSEAHSHALLRGARLRRPALWGAHHRSGGFRGAERCRPAGLPAGGQRHGLLFRLPRLADHAARQLSDLPSFFGEIVATGAHRASIRSVAAGEADACAVDCVTHALLSDSAPNELRGTRILTSSPTAPGMPFVTGAATPDEEIEKNARGPPRCPCGPVACARARAAPPYGRERSD